MKDVLEIKQIRLETYKFEHHRHDAKAGENKLNTFSKIKDLGRIIERLGQRFLNCIIILLFGFIAIEAIANRSTLISGSCIKYIIMVIVWIVLAVAFVFLMERLNLRYKKALLIAVLAMQLVYVWAVHSKVDSDAYVIAYIAYHFARGNLSVLEGFWREYMAVYTNNIPATAFIVLLFKIWIPDTIDQVWLMLSMTATLLSDIAVFFIYRLIKTIVGQRVAYVALLLCGALITLSEPSTVLYSDIIALWTIPAALYAIVVGKEDRRWRWGMAGIVLAFGAWMKPQVKVVVIAAFVTIVLEWISARHMEWHKTQKKQVVLLVGCFLGTTLCLTSITNISIDVIGKDYVRQNQTSALHFIAMGLNPETNGAYSEDDVIAMKAAIGQEAKRELNVDKIATRLQDLGIDGLLHHIKDKVVYGAGNGTFTIGREWRGELLNESLQAKRIQNWTVIFENGFENYTAVWIQCGYILTLLMCIHSAIRSVLNKNEIEDGDTYLIVNISKMTMLGTLLMLVIFERNLRYMYASLPCMIYLAMYDLQKTLESRAHRPTVTKAD